MFKAGLADQSLEIFFNGTNQVHLSIIETPAVRDLTPFFTIVKLSRQTNTVLSITFIN
jgi:hypothetical protein